MNASGSNVTLAVRAVDVVSHRPHFHHQPLRVGAPTPPEQIVDRVVLEHVPGCPGLDACRIDDRYVGACLLHAQQRIPKLQSS